VLIRGSEGRDLSSPFFSPDGTSVGYVEGFAPPYLLKRLPIVGRTATTIARFRLAPAGASWGPDNTIALGTNVDGLLRVSANGGEPEPLTRVSRKDESHRWPLVLPNGRGVLFAVWLGSLDASRIAVASFETGAVTSVTSSGTSPRYSPTGHLVYATRGSLHAVGFDTSRLTVVGDEQATVLENVHVNQATGAAYFAIAENGTLVYYASPPVTDRVTLALVDTAGKAQPIGVPGSGYQYPRVSPPDGRWVTYQAEHPDGPDIMVLEIEGRTAPSRFTFGGTSQYPVWSADGRRIIFQSSREGDAGLFWQASDGRIPAERLTTPAKGESHIPDSVSGDGNWLTFTVVRGEVSEVWGLSLRTKKAESLIAEPNARLGQSVLSPDGRWIAYQNAETLTGDVFVRPFPPTGDAKYQVPPSDGNHHPIWARDGSALYYVPAARQFARVPITTAPRFVFGTPVSFELNRTARAGGPTQLRRLDLMPDGKRFVGVWPEDLGKQPSADTERRIVVIQNWHEELKRQMSR
jgi:Tol biopolymer transport system component